MDEEIAPRQQTSGQPENIAAAMVSINNNEKYGITLKNTYIYGKPQDSELGSEQ